MGWGMGVVACWEGWSDTGRWGGVASQGWWVWCGLPVGGRPWGGHYCVRWPIPDSATARTAGREGVTLRRRDERADAARSGGLGYVGSMAGPEFPLARLRESSSPWSHATNDILSGFG